jgi:hypothetical protein
MLKEQEQDQRRMLKNDCQNHNRLPLAAEQNNRTVRISETEKHRITPLQRFHHWL